MATTNSYFGIMPPAMTPSSTSSRVLLMLSSMNLVLMSSLSRSTPGTSVIKISFSARSAAAICYALVGLIQIGLHNRATLRLSYQAM